jgi:hypothetical protein
VAGTSEHDNESSGSIRGREFLDFLSDYSFSRRTLLHGVKLVTGHETTIFQSNVLSCSYSWLSGKQVVSFQSRCRSNQSK